MSDIVNEDFAPRNASGKLMIGGTLYNNIASEPEIWDPETGTGTPIPGFEKELKKQKSALARKLAADEKKRLKKMKS